MRQNRHAARLAVLLGAIVGCVLGATLGCASDPNDDPRRPDLPPVEHPPSENGIVAPDPED